MTFVIATYQRVDALRATLRSLILQQHRDWTALVIGDCCGAETADAIRSLAEPRIRYYNLPRRFGEQSGPNSFGLHIATGDFLCFLNHDDLLLQDHLKHALNRLKAEKANFFIGKFANATELEIAGDNRLIPVFTRVMPRHLDLSYSVLEQPWLFDPSSFWLVDTEYAKRVGPWRAARDIWRTPLRDWLMRAWRRGGRFVFGEWITGLRFWTQNLRTGSPLYSNATPEHEFMIELLRTHSAGDVRQFIREQIASNRQKDSDGNTGEMPWPGCSDRRRRMEACLYRYLGLDMYTLKCRLQHRSRGELLDSLSRKRTGEGLQSQWDVQETYRNPEAYRIL